MSRQPTGTNDDPESDDETVAQANPGENAPLRGAPTTFPPSTSGTPLPARNERPGRGAGGEGDGSNGEGDDANGEGDDANGQGDSLAQVIYRFPLTRIVLFGVLAVSLWVLISRILERFGWRDDDNWTEAAAVLSALWIMGRADGISLAGFGLKQPRIALRDVLFGFIIGGLTMSAVVGSMAACGWYHGHLQVIRPVLWRSLEDAGGLYLAIAISEELIYRGYFLQTLERRWGTDIAFAATMVTFGLTHVTIAIPNATLTLRLIGALSIAVEAGILFAAAYLLTRRLWMPIGLHWAWNFFQGPVFGAPVTGSIDSMTVFRSTISGPPWATGGPFGPEASIPALTIGTAIGLIMLYVAVRKRHRKEATE
jgi:membrane protease YdiL (CAAX protease family)